LAVNAAGNPRIAYFDDTHDDLKYTWWDGAAWQYQTVDSFGEVGLHPSMVLDSSGNPHISYYDITNQELKYAYWNGSSWIATTLDTNPEVGMYSSIDLLEVNNVIYKSIAYYDGRDDNLKLAN
jgi:hypothetical protein